MRRGRQRRPPGPIIIHNLAHARAAITAAAELGVPVALHSAPDAAGYAGPGWFREVVALAHAEAPAAQVSAQLDCGAEPGHALAALRAGVAAVALAAPPGVRAKVAAIARQYGAQLVKPTIAPCLDLLDVADAVAACRAWLGRAGPTAALRKPRASAKSAAKSPPAVGTRQ